MTTPAELQLHLAAREVLTAYNESLPFRSTILHDLMIKLDEALEQSEAMLSAAPTPPEVEPIALHVKHTAFREFVKTDDFSMRDERFFNGGFDAGISRTSSPLHTPSPKATTKIVAWINDMGTE